MMKDNRLERVLLREFLLALRGWRGKATMMTKWRRGRRRRRIRKRRKDH